MTVPNAPHQPKILFYDIETMGERGWYFPPRWETNILHVDHFEHLLSVAWMWQGDKTVKVKGLDDFKTYKKDPHNDFELTKFIAELFNQANVVIAHNGDNFDQKMVNARIMKHKLMPPDSYRQIDTKKVAKKYARFPSNKLDDLGSQLELGQKLSHGNFKELWLACDNGDLKAWKVMKRYNKQDVVLLEQLYLELRPWIQNHPALNLMLNRPNACPNCGGERVHGNGTRYYKTSRTVYQRWRCYDCGAHGQMRKPDNSIEKPNFVN